MSNTDEVPGKAELKRGIKLEHQATQKGHVLQSEAGIQVNKDSSNLIS